MALPQNNAINQLLKAGPDKYSNQFSVIISRQLRSDGSAEEPYNASWLFEAVDDINKEKDGKTKSQQLETRLTALRNNLGKNQDFKIRVVDIEIPLPKSSNITTPYFDTSVERSSSKLTFTNRSAITLEMDNSFFYLDAFQKLAGHDENSVYNSKKYKYTVVAWSPQLGNLGIDAPKNKYTYFEFSDCKFLGNESDIKFNSSANVISATFPFIFLDLRILHS